MKLEKEPIVIAEFESNNFDLLRLLNGGTMNSKGALFSVRFIKTWEAKTKTGRPMHGLICQIITKGINNPVERQDVVIKKVKEKVIVEKEVKIKPVKDKIGYEDKGCVEW